MRRTLRRVLKGLVFALVIVVLLASVGGYIFIARTFPQTSGTIRVPGLRGTVEIIRDESGVPQIYADTPDDLFFAQGYVQAQDRLWQMELNRHVAHGSISELFGDTKYSETMTTVQVDKFLRTLGLDRAARADIATLDPETARYLQRFADGVNVFIHTHGGTLPLEFTLLGASPADWQPVDSIAWGKVMAYNLDSNYEAELLFQRVIDAVGRPEAEKLVPVSPANPSILPAAPSGALEPQGSVAQKLAGAASVGPVDLASLAGVNAALGLHQTGTGSNNWVVDGSRTVSGKPLLANDPHLGISMPSVWYANGLHCRAVSSACPFDVAGYSFPGTPGVIVGHNGRIAWGVTTPEVDTQDLFIEKVNPQNPNEYWSEGQWRPFELDPQTIHVKGKADVPFTIQISQHGPILSPVLQGVTATLALQWPLEHERSTLLTAVFTLDRSQNWEEFRKAMRLWDFPPQNFVYADVDGNIGYQLPGLIPIRSKGDGLTPVDGASGEYEWKGYIPFEELPSAHNPPDHMIVTANNRIVPQSYKYLLSFIYAAPFRAQRIADLLQAIDKLAVADFQAIQGDIYSIPLTRLQKYILAVKPDGFLGLRALKYVQQWDGNMKQDSIAGTVLEATFIQLERDVLASRLGADLGKSYLTVSDPARLLIYEALEDPRNPIWDDPATPAVETRDDRLLQAYSRAVDWLGSQFGDWPPDWHWGRLHTATFEHPFGSVKPLNLLLNYGPISMPGDSMTVDRESFKDSAPYEVTTISSMRQIVDLSNLDNSLWIHSTGQSGQALNPHYTDLTQPWHDVRYRTFYFTRAAVDAHRSATLTLTP